MHVTLRVVDLVPSLRRPRAQALIERVFAAERSAKGFVLVHFSIRSNHLHLICEADDAQALSRGIQRLASRLARRLNGAFGRGGRLFADRFHGRVFGSPRAARRVLRYVLCNHHKDAARTGVPVTGIDPYSSGHHFDGWADVVPSPPPRAPPVAPARSWLLREGWRREGLIRTDEYAALLLPW